jgi:hypothetical protein
VLHHSLAPRLKGRSQSCSSLAPVVGSWWSLERRFGHQAGLSSRDAPGTWRSSAECHEPAKDCMENPDEGMQLIRRYIIYDTLVNIRFHHT